MRAAAPVQFGRQLKRLRRERRLNQREVAETAGIDVTYLSKIENARLDPPAEGTIRRLALVLSCDPVDLILSAGKVPSEWSVLLTHEPAVSRFLRAASSLTKDDWEYLAREAEKRGR